MRDFIKCRECYYDSAGAYKRCDGFVYLNPNDIKSVASPTKLTTVEGKDECLFKVQTSSGFLTVTSADLNTLFWPENLY